MNVDQLISELLLREDRRHEVKVLLMDGATAEINDLVDSKPPRTVDDVDRPDLTSIVLIRLQE